MNEVITVNLAGRAYQLERAGKDALAAYLDDARRRLASDPDRDEILADIEAAIGARCGALLSDNKDVVTESEAIEIVEAMGPVQPDVESVDEPAPVVAAPIATSRKLYRAGEDRRVFGGVCAGFADYFNVDVTVVRALFVALIFFTSGGWLIAYFVLLLTMPVETAEQRRLAQQRTALSANDLLERARTGARDLADSPTVQRIRTDGPPALADLGTSILKLARGAMRVVSALAVLVLGMTLVAWVAALWSVAATGDAFGWMIPGLTRLELAALASSVAVVALVPVAVLADWFRRVATPAEQRAPRASWRTAGIVLWLVALSTLFALPYASSPPIRDLTKDGTGVVDFGQAEWCLIKGESCDDYGRSYPRPSIPSEPGEPDHPVPADEPDEPDPPSEPDPDLEAQRQAEIEALLREDEGK